MDLPAGLSPKQEAFMRGSNGRINILEGSVRSGKTIVSLLRWLIFITMAPRGGELVMIGRTRDSVWRNAIMPLQNPDLFGPIAQHVVGNVGAPTVNILGRKIWVLGASDSQAELVLRGMTLSGAYVDEITTLAEGFFKMLLSRLSVTGAQLFGSTNPDGPNHWFKKEFLDKPRDNWTFWKFRIEDNPYLDPTYVASIKAEYTGLWHRRFIQGEWVSAEGAIFDMWEPDKHVVPWAEIPPIIDFLATGIDYGTTNATAAIAIALCEDNRLYAVNEWRRETSDRERNWTDGEQSSAILKWLNGNPLAPKTEYKPQFTIIDPAAASFKTQMNADGAWNVINADNDVLYGIRTVANGLSGGWLKIADTCTGLIKEIPGYSWDPKAQKLGEDKPIKTADHSIDGFRYGVVTTENRWRPAIDHYIREEARLATTK